MKFMKLDMISWNEMTCRGKNIVPLEAGLGIIFSQTRASHNKPDGFRRGNGHIWGRNDICRLLLLSIFYCQHRTTGVLCQILGFF